MSEPSPPSPYGEMTEAASLTIQRVLPGPIERVYAYLTQDDLRRQWLASGEMELVAGARFELVWRNDELTDPPGARPQGFSDEHRMDSRIIALDPPRALTISWGERGEVSFLLEARGEEVLLTLTHRRAPDRAILLKVSAGWHMHLDILAARLSGTQPEPFWDGWSRLHADYDARLP